MYTKIPILRSETYSLRFVLSTVVVVFFLSVDAAESSKVELLEKTLLETSEVGEDKLTYSAWCTSFCYIFVKAPLVEFIQTLDLVLKLSLHLLLGERPWLQLVT